MTRGDQALETAADKLETFVQEAERQGGVKAKVGDAFRDDPEFLRKLKPSKVKARAKGKTPPPDPEQHPLQADYPSPASKAKKKTGGGPSPWLVIGAALAVGVLAAKVLDWRGHAHPRW